MNIERYILGHWSNRHQAQSDPCNWVSVEIIWKKFEHGYQSMNYKRHEGIEKAYRKKNHKLLQLSENQVLMQNYHLDWTRHEDCDMMFTFDGSVWRGQLACPGKCIGYRGDRVVSEIHCFGDKLHTCDQGYDLKTGEMVWGSKELYRFIRI
jgi:hypothetical protein|tara:strand:+ start:2225 stop:2677 length:453 start_codon:yes stop_codon:yes gene_type:complete